MDAYKTFLASYRFDGSEWSFEFKAKNAGEARDRLAQLGLARLDGELIATVPAKIGWLAKAGVYFRNHILPSK